MRISDWSSDVCSSDLESGVDPRLLTATDDDRRTGIRQSLGNGQADTACGAGDDRHLAGEIDDHVGDPLKRRMKSEAPALMEALRRLSRSWGRDRKSTRLNSSH